MNGPSQPLVSIIVNCRNSEAYLAACLDSIYAQTYPSWEIILWDNASTDRTPQIARGYDGRLRYFRSDAPSTLGRARNDAMARAQGKYLAFLDSDDKWLPRKLEQQVALMEADPACDLVYANFYKLIMPHEEHLILGLKGPQPEGDVFGRFLRRYPVNLQTVMLRVEALRVRGLGFDERLELSEEFDLFMRFLYEAKARYLDMPLAVYRIHADMSSHRHIEKYPFEMTLVLDKLRRIGPCVQARHGRAFGYFEARIAYAQARVDAERKDLLAARMRLAPYKFMDARFLAVYLLTFFPSGVWAWVQRCRMRSRFWAGL